MKLNKSSSYVLIYLLQGYKTASAISEQLKTVDIRSVQRSFVRLVDLGVIIRNGTNNPTYSVDYRQLIDLDIDEKFLVDEDRPSTDLNHRFITWLDGLSAEALEEVFGKRMPHESDAKMTAKELEYLTIELSWKSSALEGNTYTLLDTQLLLTEGIKAKNRTEFETQMILNHKDAISFIVENPELFASSIAFRTVEELHRIIGRNLGIESGVRKKIVRISASNYEPLSGPQQLREAADTVLSIISRATNPFARGLLALTLVPYLQIFEDGNKRTGRMLANALLITSISRGFSLRKTEARELALAYLSFYEFNSVRKLSEILDNELSRQ
jgi:Fic family protein